MKYIFLISCLTLALATRAQQHSLTKLWETDPVIAVPESVLPDLKAHILYVSLIDGAGWDDDGKGGVARLNMDGSHYDPHWTTGFSAPKGMGRVGDRLYVADLTHVTVIDVKKDRVVKKIAIEGADGLNDITVDSKGIVYVSDTHSGKVYRIQNDRPSVYLENLKGANGLKAVGTDLYILDGDGFYKADAQKHITHITDLPNGGDGVEPVGNGDFIVTSWVGYIYYVHADGKKELLLDTHAQKKNTADIGYDPEKRILYVPSFNGKTVAAYRLN